MTSCFLAFTLYLTVISCTKPTPEFNQNHNNITIDPYIDSLLTPIVNQIYQSYELPGLVLGIVKEQEIVYSKALGYKNLDTQEPLDINDIFHMASVSKPFVASAVMQLVELGKVDLDTPVVHYLPYFSLQGEGSKDITIRQMLTHTSGMPDVEDYQWDNPVYTEDALKNYVRSISSEQLIGLPGERFAYSNMAFECLGAVIGKISGVSFAEYQQKHILEAAGMIESTFLKPLHLPNEWAVPHNRMTISVPWHGYPYNRMHGPSSTLHSNVPEMCNWAITNMNRGVFRNNQVLKPESYESLWHPWFEIDENSHVGLSWFLGSYRGENTVGHSGGDIGFSTNFIMVPEKSIAVVVMCNQSAAPVEEITNLALDIMLGFDPAPPLVPASIPVSQELYLNGLPTAVALWDSLKSFHSEKFDFDPQHFSGLTVALYLDRIEEAESLARLCVNIFPEEVTNYLKDRTEAYLKVNPDNQSGAAIIQILEQESPR